MAQGEPSSRREKSLVLHERERSSKKEKKKIWEKIKKPKGILLDAQLETLPPRHVEEINEFDSIIPSMSIVT